MLRNNGLNSLWTVVFPKPGKKDRSLVKAYRTITLLNTFAKLSEKIIARRLLELGEEGRFDSSQFGSRMRRSSVDVLACALERIDNL